MYSFLQRYNLLYRLQLDKRKDGCSSQPRLNVIKKFMVYLQSLNPLIIVSLIPLIGIIVMLPISSYNLVLCRQIALITSCLSFLFSLLIWVKFDESSSFFQFVDTFVLFPYLNLYYIVGVDGISLFFVILTTLLILLCILVS